LGGRPNAAAHRGCHFAFLNKQSQPVFDFSCIVQQTCSHASVVRFVAALLPFLATSLGAQPFVVSTQMVLEGAPPGCRWTIPRIAAFGTNAAHPEMLMTLCKLSQTGTDVYLGPAFMASNDGGESWSPLTELPYAARPLRAGIMGVFGAVVPVFHAATGKVLLLGNCVGYTGFGTPAAKLTAVRYPAYAVYDPATRKWSPDYTVLDREEDANTTSGFPWILPNGTLLWPCNGGRVLKAAFDGVKLTILARSPQIEGLGKQPKNSGEYHLTELGNKFYLAMRCADQNRIAISADGQNFEPAVELRWDDGSLVPSISTQMRWIRQQGRLYLVYTRVDSSSQGIFRNRAPLWMAELDLATLRLKKSTEVIAVPISPGRDDLGNFGTTFVNDQLSLVTTSEFGRTRASNSRVYLARVTASGKAF
jgi:hypothetical protein